MKKIKFLIIISLLMIFPFQMVESMQSVNYQIEKDSINFSGIDDSQSANYNLFDTMGEIGTGQSEGANYTMNAGYRQMNESSISISSPSDIIMLPVIAGMTGGTGNGEATWTVITDNSTGYLMNISTLTSPALMSGVNSFSNYTPVSAGIPDYNWSIVITDSEFGFTLEGSDIVSKFMDNGVNACNTGLNNTVNKCWSNLSTSVENIAGSTSSNQPLGMETTVKFRAQSGSSHFQEEGSYSATIIITALAL